MRLAPALCVLVALPVPLRCAHVELRRGPDAPKEVVEWFSAADRLLDDYEAALRLLSAGDADSVLQAAAKAGAMADAYERVAGDAAGAGKVRAAVREMRTLLQGVKSPPRELLPRIYSLEKGSLHRWLQLMRQAALEAPGPEGRYPVNSLLTFEEDGAKVELAFLDLDEKRTADVKNAAGSGRSLQALIHAARRRPPEKETYIAGRERFWLRLYGADIFVDLGAQHGDGIIRIRYQEADGTAAGQSRFYFLSKALVDIGFAVSVRDGGLIATLGGERVSLDAYGRVELFSTVRLAVESAHRVRPFLPGYLEGSVSQADNERRLDELAAIFAAEGRLPFLGDEGSSRLRLGVMEYRLKNAAREALRAEMGATLLRFGLGEFPPHVGVGQRTIDLYYNAPIDAAAARGELKMSKGGLVLDRSYDPLGRVARKGGDKDVPFSGAGRIIGTVGAGVALRFQRRTLDGGWETYCVLRQRAARAGKYLFDAEVLYGGETSAERRAVVTYDRKEALAGGKVFVTPYLSPADADAAANSVALLTTAAGARSAFAARLAGIPALNLPQAEWSASSGIHLDLPVYGAVRRAAGKEVRPAVSYQKLVLGEGDTVRIDPKNGLLEVLDEPAP